MPTGTHSSQQWFAQLSQDLVTTRNKLDDARSSYDKAVKHQDLVRWTAAEPSVVLTMAKLSVGSVLKPGDPFITLMPIDTKLEAEIKIASRDVGFIRPGDHCVMKVDAFNSAEHGTAAGKGALDQRGRVHDRTTMASRSIHLLQGALLGRRGQLQGCAEEFSPDSGNDA